MYQIENHNIVYYYLFLDAFSFLCQVAFRDVLLPIYKTTMPKNYFSSKKRWTPLSGQEIIVSYENRNNNNPDTYLTIIPFPSNLRIDGPGGNDFSIGEAYLSDLVNGFVLIAGDTFYRVADPVTQILSNTYENPTIVHDAFVRYFLGYDGVRHHYKLVRFENAQEERTLVDCFIIGTDVDWRRVVTSDLITLVDDEWLTNDGVHTHFTNHSSRLHIICNERLENGMLRECVFSFDCQSEQEVRVVLPQEVGNPILCVLANKLCCAFFVANRLTIHQLLETTIWTILIDVVVNPPIPPIRYLPICLQDDLLLLAFRGELPGDQAFINHNHGVLLNTITGDVDLIETWQPLDWFSAKSFTRTFGRLPFN
jgi:hypothetical protein